MIQKLYNSGESIREIARITGRGRKTVKKYLEGDPDILCRSNQRSPLEVYTDFIVKSITDGQTASAMAKRLKENGCSCTVSNIRQYVTGIADKYGLELSKYVRTSSKYDSNGEKKPKQDYITRKGIFNDLWMNTELSPSHREYLWKKFDTLPGLEACIREFREIFNKKNMP